MKILGRKREIKKITNYASSEPENQAFFGVKGLGKSILFENVFSKANCKMYADDYQVLYVRTILQPEKKGEDLINFLLDRVINGIDLISDDILRNDINQRIKEEANKFHSKDSLLREALETIRDNGYSMVLIMDEFHNMGRNSNVGSEQYDFLRSLNELGLIYYWIVSDSDFSDVYATSQFTTSFFAQKFNPKTIPQMNKEDMLEYIGNVAEKNDIDLKTELRKRIVDIIGGIPGFVAPSVMCIETIGERMFNEDVFVEHMLENPKCLSLLTSWSRSLTVEQKDILNKIASSGKVTASDIRENVGKINQLGDISGLGLLIHEDVENGRYWSINSKLFATFILNKSEMFYSADVVSSSSANEEIKQNSTTYNIQNNYYTVNNNFFNPSNAVEALLNLKKMVGTQDQILLPDNELMTAVIKQLPYEQAGWDSMEQEEKEEKMEEYTDRIFSSSDFRADSLSENQMERFSLNNNILSCLSETSRNNLISAIQVYDLLQFCVDRFGLNMLNSESARGILFAKLYESILKESLSPALCSVIGISDKIITIDRNSYSISEAPVNKMTIGNYAYILGARDTQNILATICISDIHKATYNALWWRKHKDDMYQISDLRNKCCHSGNLFNSNQLNMLIDYLFNLGAIAAIEIYNDITNR